MGKKVDNTVLDAMLAEIATADRMDVNSAEPSNVSDARTTTSLANVAMTPGDGNDYTIANGDTSGRKVTTAQKAAVSVTSSGTANHVSLTTATVLLYVTTCTAQALTSGNTVTIPGWKVEVADPA